MLRSLLGWLASFVRRGSSLPAPAPAGPFPKRCGCGRIHADRMAWSRLDWCGFQDDGEGGLLALRHCSCKSTLAVPAPFDDASTRRERPNRTVIIHQGLAS